MSKRPVKNVAHSVHSRLLNAAKAQGRPFQELLDYYSMERFLYRLSVSPHAHAFVLKGGLMLLVWRGPFGRSTRDIDLLGRMDNTPDAVARVVRDICVQDVEDDGLVFEPDSVEATAITEDADYSGVRVRFRGALGNAVVHMQVDIGFSDALPAPEDVDYPTLLDFPAPRLKGYTREKSIAEKLEAMVKRGELNSRMRDFYDIWLLSREFEFDGAVLAENVRRTFEDRGTPLEAEPLALTPGFAQIEGKQALWRGFLRTSRFPETPSELTDVISAVRDFLEPVLASLAAGQAFTGTWRPGEGWS